MPRHYMSRTVLLTELPHRNALTCLQLTPYFDIVHWYGTRLRKTIRAGLQLEVPS